MDYSSLYKDYRLSNIAHLLQYSIEFIENSLKVKRNDI